MPANVARDAAEAGRRQLAGFLAATTVAVAPFMPAVAIEDNTAVSPDGTVAEVLVDASTAGSANVEMRQVIESVIEAPEVTESITETPKVAEGITEITKAADNVAEPTVIPSVEAPAGSSKAGESEGEKPFVVYPGIISAEGRAEGRLMNFSPEQRAIERERRWQDAIKARDAAKVTGVNKDVTPIFTAVAVTFNLIVIYLVFGSNELNTRGKAADEREQQLKAGRLTAKTVLKEISEFGTTLEDEELDEELDEEFDEEAVGQVPVPIN